MVKGFVRGGIGLAAVGCADGCAIADLLYTTGYEEFVWEKTLKELPAARDWWRELVEEDLRRCQPFRQPP